MPRSPWLASPGCTKKAGVPVEASVAAILRATWPDLPMPLTTTRPLQARISWQASTKSAPMRGSSARTAAASVAITVRALRDDGVPGQVDRGGRGDACVHRDSGRGAEMSTGAGFR